MIIFSSTMLFDEVMMMFELYGAKNLKSITEECRVNIHWLVYSRSKFIGTKVDMP